MIVFGKPMTTLFESATGVVTIIDQTALPDRLALVEITSSAEMVHAIATMQVRGAPLIGVAAAYGMALAMRSDPTSVASSAEALRGARPTAVNLAWAVAQAEAALTPLSPERRYEAALTLARALREDDVRVCRALGEVGATWLRERFGALSRPLQIMTHCNAGWLATIDHGTALAPVYRLHEEGVPVHVWVSETRPRNQGLLTAWELKAAGVPFTLIADNAAGHLMQRGEVDVCIVGSDRTTLNGDVCNKIGTYLKALAARANNVPFLAVVPCSTIDQNLETGAEIPIEERNGAELSSTHPVKNPAFDVTPADLVTAIITERGVAQGPAIRSMVD